MFRDKDEFEKIIDKLDMDVSTNYEHKEKLKAQMLERFDDSERTGSAAGCVQDKRRKIMSRPIMKLAAVAAVLLVVFSGISLWPSGNREGSQWWLGPSSVWGQEILSQLDTVEALVYRRQAVFVGSFGSTHVSGNWDKIYEAYGMVRKDKFYEDTDEDTFGETSANSILQDTTWQLSEGSDLIEYTVSYEFECYTIKEMEGYADYHDPVERIRECVNLIDEADVILGTKEFDGRECVGFEISASKYGDNPEDFIDRVWFDVETKLPARIEKHGMPVTDWAGETLTSILDRFEYYAQVPAELFEPVIPEGFVNEEPGVIRAERERLAKEEMVFADVPAEIAERTKAALENVKTAVYNQYEQDGQWIKKVHCSRYNWCIDCILEDEVRRTDWFVIDANDAGRTGFDFNVEDFSLIKTSVDYVGKNFEVSKYDRVSHPENPLDRIIFIAGLIDKADVFVEDEQLDGIGCYFFEVSAKKYGTNPDTMKHHVWIDSETYLPVRMEFEWMQDDGLRIEVKKNFVWNNELGEEIFTPVIPEGFRTMEQ